MKPFDFLFTGTSNGTVEYRRSARIHNLHLWMNVIGQEDVYVQANFNTLFTKLICCFAYLWQMWSNLR